MEHPGEGTPKSPDGLAEIIGFCIGLLGFIGLVISVLNYSGRGWIFLPLGGFSLLTLLGCMHFLKQLEGPSSAEEARQRVRQAEEKLSDALRRGSNPASFDPVRSGLTLDDLRNEPPASEEDVTDDVVWVGEDGFFEFDTDALRDKPPGFKLKVPPFPLQAYPAFQARPSNDGLTLAALWDLTFGRLELYHRIVTGQARRSFIAAQVAMGTGFVLLVVFAVLAVEAKTTTAAVSAGGLGAVGAAFSGYLGKTLIRSQETAANHLRLTLTSP